MTFLSQQISIPSSFGNSARGIPVRHHPYRRLELVLRKAILMTSPFARFCTLAVLSISAALLPSSGKAQTSAAPSRDSLDTRMTEVTVSARGLSADSLPVAGPRIHRAGVTAPVAIRSDSSKPQNDAHVGAGSNVAMMGVGLAAIVVGSLVGGDGGTIIAIGGGVIGLIGLFRYLR